MKFQHERQIDALMRIYQEAEARLARDVESALRSGQLGTATYRRSQLAQVSGLITQLQSQVLPQAAAILQAGYNDGQLIANLANVNSALTGIHTEAVNMLADSLTNRLGQGFANIGRQVEDVYRKEGLRLAALSLAEGSTRADASNSLIDTLVDQGVSGFTDRAGRDWGLSAYSEMVLRTTTREAVSEGTKNRLIEGGMDLVEWAGNGENCDECQALEGQMFSLTGDTDGYEVIVDMPPLHPNCTCVLIPSTVTFETLERELGIDPPAPVQPEPPKAPPLNGMEAFDEWSFYQSASLGTADARAALSSYVRDGHGPLNQALGDGVALSDELATMRDALDDAIARQDPIKQDTMLFRGNPFGNSDLDNAAEGDEFRFPTFVSTSASESVSESFAGHHGGWLMEIRAPAGSRGIVPESHVSVDWPEREVVLPRGSKFRVVSVDRSIQRIRLELIP